METLEFFKNLGIAVLGILFAGGFGYWTLTLIKKIKPDFKHWFKYIVRKKKYDEGEVQILLDYDQAGTSIDQVHKFLLIKGGFSKEKVEELCWIYAQIKLKGGDKR